ncbi:MAG TPA: amino acid adenylation domain-containing protein, partial [Lysobacter sp.]
MSEHPELPATAPSTHHGFEAMTQRIERQAARTPDAIAVTADGVSLTYGELNRRANRLAHRLRRLGVGPESLVAIGMERSAELVVGLLAIHKSGGAYLPIDLAYPRERLEFVFADAKPAVVLTTRALRAQLPDCDAPTLELEADWAAFADEPDSDPEPITEPGHLAYVIYTSGSTGKPKGCLVTHHNVLRLFTATEAWFHFGPQDVWTFFHSHAFDFSVWEIWGALLYGGRVVVVPYAVSRSPEAFHALLVRERVTVLNQTPSAFRNLVRADAASGAEASAFALRYVIFGGEALELQMLRPWFERHGDVRPQLVNMYGITETTVHVTYRPIGLADLERNAGSVIGRPIPDLQLHVLDADLRPVPVGEVGEIHVGGAGVTRGYLNRPELTAERFIDWTGPDGERMRLYRSGDLARPLEGGDLEYLGRSDHQVKIRGFRIETGEIESALMRHPGVSGCAVIARTDGADSEARLVAYIVAGAQPVPHPALRAHLGGLLPEFMVPSAFIDMHALPLTENGKLDRAALPAPGHARPDLATDFEPAADAREAVLCRLFQDVLGVEPVGRHDNFFELGGSSMLAVRLVERIKRAQDAGLDALPGAASIATPVLFQNPTPARLAQALSGEGAVDVRAGRRGRRDDVAEPIAIIGMAGRFPGANDVEAFWRNLCEGR